MTSSVFYVGKELRHRKYTTLSEEGRQVQRLEIRREF